MWIRVGGAMITARTEEVDLGSIDAPLADRYLPLRIRSTTSGGLRPLSFGIVVPVPATDLNGLPTGRYYPENLPSLVALGPGIGTRFAGRLRFRPRNYNQKWLSVGHPGPYWSLVAEAWAPGSVASPTFNLYGYTDGAGLTFTISPDRVGPSGAAPLERG